MKEWQRWCVHNEACGVNMAKHCVLVKLWVINMEVHMWWEHGKGSE
jgi:hypothetical protein